MGTVELQVLALDGKESDEQIFILRAKSDWTLGDLRNALKNHYTTFNKAFLDQIKVWAVEGYVPENILFNLDPKTTPICNGVTITKIEAIHRRRILSYFQIPFGSNDVDRIHLIVKLSTNLVLLT
jgi:hypothetical protein